MDGDMEMMRFIAGMLCILAASQVNAKTEWIGTFDEIYIGIDTGGLSSSLKNKPGYGDNIFKDSFYEYSFHCGKKFTRNFGLEVGYTKQYAFNWFHEISDRVHIPGHAILPSSSKMTVDTSQEATHIYLGITNFFPLTERMNTFAMAGLSFSDVAYDMWITWLQFKQERSPVNRGGMHEQYYQSRFIPVLKFGINYRVDLFEVKGFAQWRNTKMFKINGVGFISSNKATEVRLEDSYSVGLSTSFYLF